MATMPSDDIVIGYDERNRAACSGAPLVLVHGHPFDRSMWRPQLEHLDGTGRWVIAPDLRGYGETTVVPGKTTLTRFATDLADLLDRLGVGDIVLGGLSMGGQIVMEFHRLFPDRLRGLILADTSPEPETAAGKRWRHELADRLVREGMAGYATEILPKMVAPANIAAFPAVAEHVLGIMRRTAPEGAAAALRGRAERPDYVPMLARIAVPTLVVVGSQDEFTPVGVGEFLREHIPGATLAVIDGAGHLPNLERPAPFNRAVDTFLAALAETAGADEVQAADGRCR